MHSQWNKNSSKDIKTYNQTSINKFHKSLKPRYNLHWLIAIGLICIFIYAYSPKPFIPKYNEGEIAKETIKSPENFSILDEDSTNAKRMEAQQSVAPVYDYDPMIKMQVLSNLKTLFAEGDKFLKSQDIIANEQNSHKKLTLAKNANLFTQIIKDTLKIELTDEISKALLTDDFSPEIKEILAEIIDLCMKNKIISDKKVIRFNSKGEFVLRDIALNTELNKSSSVDMLSLAEAYKLIDELILSKENTIPKAHIPAYSQLIKLLIMPNVSFNSKETTLRRENARINAESVFINVKKGQVIIREGDVISKEKVKQLQYLYNSKKGYKGFKQFFLIITVISFGLFFIYVISKNYPIHEILLRDKNILILTAFIYGINLIVLRVFQFLIGAISGLFLSSPYNEPNEYFYAIPFALGAFSIAILINSQFALAYSLVFSLTSVLLVEGDLDKYIYILVSSVVASFSIRSYKQRSDLIKASLLIALANIGIIIYVDSLRNILISYNNLIFHAFLGFINAMFAYMIAAAIIPVIEIAFRILTEFKLLELSNINSPLIREMAIKAPGTYHHSIVVSVLAERASEAIRLNSLFVRVAALYHDVGKIINPELFIENQKGHNIHEKYPPLKSAKLIIEHVTHGYELGKKYKLPKDVIDVILQHHGTKVVSYFYSKAVEQMQRNGKPDADEFRYPGPKPQSKESAILMIADAVEAASRTIEHAEPDVIKNLVNRIIRDCIEDEQLNECNITIKELDIIGQSMVDILMDMKHGRIDYPGFDFTKPNGSMVGSLDDTKDESINLSDYKK
jgi:putative nucleotidyltransferase with HDIG domain